MREVVCAIALSLVGCGLSAGPCEVDNDCDGDLVCDATGECSSAADAPAWRITWTVNGQPVAAEAPGDCARVTDLSLEVRASFDGERIDFYPVGCALGQFAFRALPSRFDRVTVEAFDGRAVLDSESARRDGEVTSLDLGF